MNGIEKTSRLIAGLSAQLAKVLGDDSFCIGTDETGGVTVIFGPHGGQLMKMALEDGILVEALEAERKEEELLH